MKITIQDIINLLYLILLPISFFAGYRIGQKSAKNDYLYYADNVKIWKHKPIIQEEISDRAKQIYNTLEANPNAEKLSKKDDIINHEGVGIVYRPTEEEINKMNEPESERQAKEAVAETLRNAPPAPEI